MYKKNKNLHKILNLLKNEDSESSLSEISFVYKDNLFYYIKKDFNYLIILKSLYKEIFHLIHNENSYAELYQSY